MINPVSVLVLNHFRLVPHKGTMLSILSGLMFLLCYPEIDFYPFVFVTFVPLLFATETASLKAIYCYCIITGMIMFAPLFNSLQFSAHNFYGFSNATSVLVWIGYSYFIANKIFLIILFSKAIKSTQNVTPVLVFPVVGVIIWSKYPDIFSIGLSNLLVSAPVLLQGIKITGSLGLDFIVFMINMFFYLLIKCPSNFVKTKAFKSVSITILVWITFGAWNIADLENEVKHGPRMKVGIIQPNIDLYDSNSENNSYNTLKKMIGLSKSAVLEDAKILIWPEGLGLNFGPLGQLKPFYKRAIARLDKPVIFNVTEAHIRTNRVYTQSVTYLADTDGFNEKTYIKNKPVPFGEYLPGITDMAQLRDTLGLDTQSMPGSQAISFEAYGLKLQTFLCYEILFPEFIANAISGDMAMKIVILQANLNDYGPKAPGSEHLTYSILRSIENNVPIVHLSNNGPSMVVNALGQVVYRGKSNALELAVIDVPYNVKHIPTFYAKHPKLFDAILYIAFSYILLLYYRKKYF